MKKHSNSLTWLLILLLIINGQKGYSQKVDPLMTSVWQTFQWPYNAAFPECDPNLYGAINGHIGNACGPTAISKLLHYHKHPVSGTGSHSYTDENGYNFSADFEATYYKWSEMSDLLTSNNSEEEYWPVAELIYHSHILLEDPYQTGRSLADVCRLLKKYMRYSDDMYVAYRFDYTDAEFISLLKSELDAGRPLLIESWTENSTPPDENGNHEGHYWNIDGYNEKGQFHVIWNVAGDHGWQNFDNLGFDMSCYYIWALIQAEPDNSQKTIELVGWDRGPLLKKDNPLELSWIVNNINSLHLDFTYDGENWMNFAENVDASANSYSWSDGPDTYSKSAALRIRDAENPYYQFVYDGVEVYETQQVVVHSPVSSDSYQVGSGLCVGWNSDGLYEVNIEYRESGQEEWSEIAKNLPANQHFYNWDHHLPAGKSFDLQVCKSDRSVIGLSNSFIISPYEQVGGPYFSDSHSLLLMHFDQDLKDEVNPNLGINWKGQGLAFDYSVPGKGAAIHLLNTSKTENNHLAVEDQAYLNLRGSFTIDFWFMVNSWSMSHVNKPVILTKPINSRYSNYSLVGDGVNGNVVFSIQTDMGTVSVTSVQGGITTGNWYHVAMIHDVENHEISLVLHNARKERIDEQITQYEDAAVLLTAGQDLLIGGPFWSGDYFDGHLDEVRISRVVREFNSDWSGLETHSIINHFTLYPNPAKDLIYIRSGKIASEEFRIQVFDLEGKLLHQHDEDPRGVTPIDLTAFDKGVYLIKIISDNMYEIHKVIKTD